MKWCGFLAVCAWTCVSTWAHPAHQSTSSFANPGFNGTTITNNVDISVTNDGDGTTDDRVTTDDSVTIDGSVTFDDNVTIDDSVTNDDYMTDDDNVRSTEEPTTEVTSVSKTTDFTRSPKSATEDDEPFLLSLQLQTSVPKRQCGRRFARNARIVGGGDTYEGEFPWAVSVRLLTTHYCGGAIINKYWILTAAHCVKRYSARYFRIRVGEHDVSKNGFRSDVDVHVDEVSVHPGFGTPRRYSNDLALLRLKRPLTFDNYAQPICLPDPQQSLEGKNATAVGWGWMNEIQKVKPDVLQKVQVPILNNSVCAKWYADVYNGYVQIYDYQICAGFKEGKKDSCQGDSGGPLVIKEGDHFSIIGVVSAGVGCGREKLPGIYSRVSLFVPWIQQVTGVQI